MNRELADIRNDLLKLAARVGRLEDRLSVAKSDPATSLFLDNSARDEERTEAPAAEFGAEVRPFEIEQVRTIAAEPTTPELAAVIAESERPERETEKTELSPSLRDRASVSDSPSLLDGPSERKGGVLGIGSFEAAVGGRWYAIAGALIVVVGIGIFLTVAVQRGWLVLRPSYRCIAAGVFGLALIGTGERLRARVNAAASTGLFAAGVGVVFAACHVAHSMYGLVSSTAAATLLSVATLIGIGVALRAGSSFLAALSVALAYVTPWMTMRENSAPVAIPAYAISLLVLGQFLGIRRPRVFSWAMRVAWLGAAITGGAWIVLQGRSSPLISLSFSVVTWGIVQFGLWARARGRFADERTESPFDLRLWGDPVSSFVSTCWAFAGVYFVCRTTGVVDPAIAAFGLAGGSLFGAHARGPSRTSDRASAHGAERLGVSQLVQAGSLIVVGLALALPTSTITVAFLVFGAGAMLAAERINSRGLLVYGAAVVVIGTARAVTLDLLSPALRAGVEFVGLRLTLWSAVVFAAGLAWVYAARVCAGFGVAWRRIAYGWLAIASALALAAVLGTRPDMRAAAVAASVVAGAMAMSGPLVRGLRTEWVGGPLMLVPIMLWVSMYDVFDVRAAGVGAPLGAVWVGLWIAAVLLLVRTRFDRTLSGLRLCIAAMALGCVLGATSAEVGRFGAAITGDVTVRRAVVSAWWGIFAVVMVVVGFAFAKRSAGTAHALRVGGLALLGAGALKAVVFDLGGVSALGRAGSLIGLGLLMMGVAAAYAKAKKALEPANCEA